jgi:hypothetical protein
MAAYGFPLFLNISMAAFRLIFQGGIMDIQLNDILIMKKPHPCGEKRWLVLRTGADFRLKCMGCGHEVMTARFKAEKNIRQVLRAQNPSTDSSGG